MALMKKTDQWGGVVLLIISVFICWGSIQMPYGSIHYPGAGFFPLWLGVILGAMSAGLILKATKQKQGAKMIRDLLAEKIYWRKALFVLIALIAYAYLLDLLGFLIVTFLFMAFLFWFIEPQPWKSIIGWALVGCVGSYLIFEVWLKLRLPKGFLGI
jgi:putative tricarboxylic transport membrane protein